MKFKVNVTKNLRFYVPRSVYKLLLYHLKCLKFSRLPRSFWRVSSLLSCLGVSRETTKLYLSNQSKYVNSKIPYYFYRKYYLGILT